MKLTRERILVRPDNHQLIRAEAEKLLKRAGISGKYPTSVQDLLSAAKIGEIETSDIDEIHKSFLKRVSGKTSAILNSALGKIRGIADLKKQIIYIAPEVSRPRVTWVKLHELGHQVISWQRDFFQFASDDNTSLSAKCEELFDHEANAFAAELLFQGQQFLKMASDYRPTFDAVFELADLHGASRQATARRFVEECDEEIALLSYYPSKFLVNSKGDPILNFGSVQAASSKFLDKYSEIDIPQVLDPGHAWASARDLDTTVDGEMILGHGSGSKAQFLWQAWWNNYNLFVLLRKRPTLTILRKGLS